jgi:hypothetical protein
VVFSYSPLFTLPQPVFWEVRVGEHNQKVSESHEKTYQVSQVFHYPWYRGYDNDIALMKLDKPIEPSEYVQPICLPPDVYQEFQDRECVATGWGKVDYSKNFFLKKFLVLISKSTLGTIH